MPVNPASCYSDIPTVAPSTLTNQNPELNRAVVVPDAVKNSSVLEDPQQLVLCGDVVEIGAFLVGEEQVGLPDRVQHGGIQIQ